MTLNDDVVVLDGGAEEEGTEPYIATITRMWTDPETSENLVKCKWYFTKSNIPPAVLDGYNNMLNVLENEVCLEFIL